MDLTFAYGHGILNYLERKILVLLVKIDSITSGKKMETDNTD